MAVPSATVQGRKGEVQLETSTKPLLSLDAHQWGLRMPQVPPAEPILGHSPKLGQRIIAETFAGPLLTIRSRGSLPPSFVEFLLLLFLLELALAPEGFPES